MKTQLEQLNHRLAIIESEVFKIKREISNLTGGGGQKGGLLNDLALSVLPFDTPMTTRELRSVSYGWRKLFEQPEHILLAECERCNIKVIPFKTDRGVSGRRFIRRQF